MTSKKGTSRAPTSESETLSTIRLRNMASIGSRGRRSTEGMSAQPCLADASAKPSPSGMQWPTNHTGQATTASRASTSQPVTAVDQATMGSVK